MNTEGKFQFSKNIAFSHYSVFASVVQLFFGGTQLREIYNNQLLID